MQPPPQGRVVDGGFVYRKEEDVSKQKVSSYGRGEQDITSSRTTRLPLGKIGGLGAANDTMFFWKMV